MQDQIREAITKVIVGFGLTPVDFSVEHPEELSHGDYASNVALKIFGPLSHETDASWTVGRPIEEIKEFGNPRECAERILAELEKNKPAEVEKIKIAGPGFINFHLSRGFFADRVREVLEKGDDWGKNDSLAGKKVMVEYTDPNPFKELHIGHLVPNAIGESLARLFMFAGADTKRVTYQGDVGMHVARAIYGMQKMNVTPDSPLTAADLGKAYALGAKASEDSPEAAVEITKLNKMIYGRGDQEINALYDKGKAVSLASFEEGYKILGSDFDHNFSESETGPVGMVAVKAHPEIFETSEGATIFRGEQYGLHTRVFINSEGLPTYEAKDIGLMELKYQWWPFDISITVTGNEQKQYFAVMKKAAELVNPKRAAKIELVTNGMLRLPSGKMSSRTGNIIPALTLILTLIKEVQQKMLGHFFIEGGVFEYTEKMEQDVAVGAIKYAILRSSAGKDIVFDIEQSISLEGASGPYLQYTHARICSILAKAKQEGVVASSADVPEKVYDIERMLYQFPEVTERAVLEREPHYVVTYLTGLAGVFNSWYAQEQIVNSQDQYSPYKVAVAEAVAQTLKNGLWTLGIKAPERM